MIHIAWTVQNFALLSEERHSMMGSGSQWWRPFRDGGGWGAEFDAVRRCRDCSPGVESWHESSGCVNIEFLLMFGWSAECRLYYINFFVLFKFTTVFAKLLKYIVMVINSIIVKYNNDVLYCAQLLINTIIHSECVGNNMCLPIDHYNAIHNNHRSLPINNIFS